MKINKIFKIIIIFLLILNFTLPVVVNGSNGNFNVNSFEGKSSSGEINTVIDKTLGSAISIVRIVGVGIAIITLTVIACKYMISSPGERADIKKSAVPFVIGAVVLFGASGILGIIVKISESIK